MIDTRHPKKMLRLAQLELRSLAPVEGMRSSATARAAVLAGLWSHYDARTDAPVWPSQRLLADLAGGTSVATVQRALHDLEALGLFKRSALTAAERARRQTTRYHLRLSTQWDGAKGGPASNGSKGGLASNGSKGGPASDGSKGGTGSSGSRADLLRRATAAAEADRLEGAAAAAAAAAKQARHIALLRAGDPVAISRCEAEHAWAESFRLEGLAAQRARVACAARLTWVDERDAALERLRAILEEPDSDNETESKGTAEIGAALESRVDGRADDDGAACENKRTGSTGPVEVVGVDAQVLDLEPIGGARAALAVAARPAIEVDDWMRARRAELKRQLAGVLASEAQRAALLAKWSGAAVLALVFVLGLFSSVLGSAKVSKLGSGTVSGYLAERESFRESARKRGNHLEGRHADRRSDSSGGRFSFGLGVVLGQAGGHRGCGGAAPLRYGAGAGSHRGAVRAALLSRVPATTGGPAGSELGAGSGLAARVGVLRGAVDCRGGRVLAGVLGGLAGSSGRTLVGVIAGVIEGDSRDCAGDQASKHAARRCAEGSREPDSPARLRARVGQAQSRNPILRGSVKRSDRVA